MECDGLPAQNARTAPRQLARKLALAASLEIHSRRYRLFNDVRLNQRYLPVGRLARGAADRANPDGGRSVLLLRVGVCPGSLSLGSGPPFSRSGTANFITIWACISC